jgi:hypothetical protein
MSEEMKPDQANTETEERKVTEGDNSPAPQWEYKNEFALVSNLREVIKLTMKATEAEISALQKKLEKLQYGG